MPASPKAMQFRGLPPNSRELPNLALSIPVLNSDVMAIQVLFSSHLLFVITQSGYSKPEAPASSSGSLQELNPTAGNKGSVKGSGHFWYSLFIV